MKQIYSSRDRIHSVPINVFGCKSDSLQLGIGTITGWMDVYIIKLNEKIKINC